MKPKLLYLVLISLVVASCSNGTKQDTELKHTAPVGVPLASIDNSTEKPVNADLLAGYLDLFPDTSKTFGTWKAFGDYLRPLQKRFENAKSPAGLPLFKDESASIEFVKSEFKKAIGSLVIKNLRMLPKDKLSMSLLIAHIEHEDMSVSERLALFELYPVEIQQSSVGEKTKRYLADYNTKRNLGFDFSVFNNVEMSDKDARESKVSSIINNESKYTLLLFGASWCHPCRIEERQLKRDYKRVDTSLVKIVSIMLDKNHDSFKNYLNDEQFPWNCYRMDDGFENSMIKTLQLPSLPSNYLLDKTGVVIMQDVSVFKLLAFLKM